MGKMCECMGDCQYSLCCKQLGFRRKRRTPTHTKCDHCRGKLGRDRVVLKRPSAAMAAPAAPVAPAAAPAAAVPAGEAALLHGTMVRLMERVCGLLSAVQAGLAPCPAMVFNDHAWVSPAFVDVALASSAVVASFAYDLPEIHAALLGRLAAAAAGGVVSHGPMPAHRPSRLWRMFCSVPRPR